MKLTNGILVLITFISFLVSCSKDGNEIEMELRTYFEAFEEEAAQRNLNIDLSDYDLSGYIQNIETRGTIGQCKSYSDGSQIVILDQSYWSRSTDIEKEYVVFHELGHCILGKEHNDSSDEQGVCKSIMQSGGNSCLSNYNINNKEELLDELFAQ